MLESLEALPSVSQTGGWMEVPELKMLMRTGRSHPQEIRFFRLGALFSLFLGDVITLFPVGFTLRKPDL